VSIHDVRAWSVVVPSACVAFEIVVRPLAGSFCGDVYLVTTGVKLTQKTQIGGGDAIRVLICRTRLVGQAKEL
jgi:hypothetical protein